MKRALQAAVLLLAAASAQAADPVRFADLSLSVIKLMGAGEYAVEVPGGDVSGDFGLAVNWPFLQPILETDYSADRRPAVPRPPPA